MSLGGAYDLQHSPQFLDYHCPVHESELKQPVVHGHSAMKINNA